MSVLCVCVGGGGQLKCGLTKIHQLPADPLQHFYICAQQHRDRVGGWVEKMTKTMGATGQAGTGNEQHGKFLRQCSVNAKR